jgi:hypothetical protein
MSWNENSWNRALCETRGALRRRDRLSHLQKGGGENRGDHRGLREERQDWEAHAKAHLRLLANLARQAPEPKQARAKVSELAHWYQSPGVEGG